MFSDSRLTETLEVRKEGRGLLQTTASLGTALILPSVFKTIRYYEIEIVRSAGGVYMGTCEVGIASFHLLPMPSLPPSSVLTPVSPFGLQDGWKIPERTPFPLRTRMQVLALARWRALLVSTPKLAPLGTPMCGNPTLVAKYAREMW